MSFLIIEDRLNKNDEELNRILSGDKLVELEIRKTGIRDAFTCREARVEGIYLEIDEKNEAVEKLKQTIRIKEVKFHKLYTSFYQVMTVIC